MVSVHELISLQTVCDDDEWLFLIECYWFIGDWRALFVGDEEEWMVEDFEMFALSGNDWVSWLNMSESFVFDLFFPFNGRDWESLRSEWIWSLPDALICKFSCKSSINDVPNHP